MRKKTELYFLTNIKKQKKPKRRQQELQKDTAEFRQFQPEALFSAKDFPRLLKFAVLNHSEYNKAKKILSSQKNMQAGLSNIHCKNQEEQA